MKNKIVILIGILGLALIYYFSIYRTTEDRINELNSSVSNLRNEIEIENSKLIRISEMSEEIEEGKASGSMIYDYDNSTLELSFLSSAFVKADDYNINFDDATSDGMYIRRGVSVTFTANNYFLAKEIISEITNCPYRTIFKNVTIIPISDTGSKLPSLSKGSRVSVQAELIFIELYSGNDAGLKKEGG